MNDELDDFLKSMNELKEKHVDKLNEHTIEQFTTAIYVVFVKKLIQQSDSIAINTLLDEVETEIIKLTEEQTTINEEEVGHVPEEIEKEVLMHMKNSLRKAKDSVKEIIFKIYTDE